MERPAANSALARTFAVLRAAGRVGLVSFIPAGYPDLETTAASLLALQAGGASAIEVGIPFSDPIADGPIIQEAFAAALSHKVKVGDVFKTVGLLRGKLTVPLVAMLSYSIIYRYGLAPFLRDAKEAGFSGLIIPDLPPPEAQSVCSQIWAAGLDTILLIAPTTAPERRKQIADLSTGFVYYLSVSGITGERDQLPADLARNIAELRTLTDRPICVGFGIHKPHHLAQLTGLADGAIVGTAYVRRMKEHVTEGPEQISRVLEQYTGELTGVPPK
jgi:tryptophan synthase alpha chain